MWVDLFVLRMWEKRLFLVTVHWHEYDYKSFHFKNIKKWLLSLGLLSVVLRPI